MGDIVSFVRDSLTSLTSRMGTERDKAASTFYGAGCLTDDQIINAYRNSWIPRKIVDIPAFDSVRAWRDWQAESDQIELIEAEEKRLNLKAKVLEAKIKARLWGGSAIMIGTGETNLSVPLDPARIVRGGVKYLTVMTCRELTAGEIERDPTSEWYGRPKFYRVASASGQSFTIDPSRLIIFIGVASPDESLTMTAYPGWGDSVLQSIMTAIKQADGTAANIASMVFEAKVDVIRIPGFMQNLADAKYREKILERYSLANTAKGINGTLLLDKEEEYETKGANFANLPEIWDRSLQVVSGAADIPATRFLGQSPSGMSATGESDTRNYYDRISASQEIETTPAMHRFDECLIRSATGMRDPAIYYTWAPLWGMSEKEKADVFKTKADAARVIVGTGGSSPSIIPIEAMSDALVNELIEDGSLSGLDAAIKEFGTLSEQANDPAEELAAMTTVPVAPPANTSTPA